MGQEERTRVHGEVKDRRGGIAHGAGFSRREGCGQAEEGFKKAQAHGDGFHHIFFFFFFYVPFSILSFFILDFAGTTLSNTYILLTSTGFAILKGAMT